MVFSSVSFLFFFLPLLLIVYFVVPKRFKNYVLLAFSLFFYYFGEKNFIVLLIATSLINYILGIIIEKKQGKLFLILGIVINVGILFYYKYANFFLENFHNLFQMNLPSLKVVLPLGISFFTFQNISYLVDVYWHDVKAQRNVFYYCMYITFFPQLIAGPIVRYKDINDQLNNRVESFEKFSQGVIRFIIGLGKKILIADTLYYAYTAILGSSMSTMSYWLVALIFTFQIYYDFSGYSDMAIGLSKMFGFELKENFNYPLIASSITDFWRRWHMSLSSFFRDYIYIPLGGNRCSVIKNMRNILIVWLLTGFWHGAEWNFIIWGLYFAIFLLLEKFVFKKVLKKGMFSHIYTFLIVLVSFVIFSVTDLSELVIFLKGMFGIGCDFINFESIYYLKVNFVILVISVIGMGPLLINMLKKFKEGKLNKLVEAMSIVFIFGIFLLSVARIISSSFNPFIYFRF